MKNSQLDTTLEYYKTAIDRLKAAGTSIDTEQVLEVLNARNAVQVALKDATFISTSRLKQLLELDAELRKQAGQINKVIKAEQFALWRESIHLPAEAWWWRLENLSSSHKWNSLDWLWKGLVVAGWTANLSLLINIATRFFSGGAGFLGASAVILPSILALLHVTTCNTNRSNLQSRHFQTRINCNYNYASARINCN